MPLPQQFRFTAPNMSPAAPPQHAQNVMALEQTFDRLPFFPEHIWNGFPQARTVTDWRSVVGVELVFTKEFDETDLMVGFTGTAAGSLAGSGTFFRAVLFSIDNPDAPAYIKPTMIGYVAHTQANIQSSAPMRARLKRVPRGRWRLAVQGRSNPANSSSSWTTGSPFSLSIQETAVGLNLPESRNAPA